MSSLSPRSTMSDAPEVSPASAKNPEQHPLDVLTGGAFSAETSGDRAARIRDWLATQPSVEQLQDVLKELSARDKGAARAVRERLDEIDRKSTRLNSSHLVISYAVFCLKKKTHTVTFLKFRIDAHDGYSLTKRSLPPA